MGKTKRNASRWMESRFKLGDTQYPEENETHYFNGRYQNKMRNGNCSYYSMEIDPLSYKVISWREYGNWAKRDARQAARHNDKLLQLEVGGGEYCHNLCFPCVRKMLTLLENAK